MFWDKITHIFLLQFLPVFIMSQYVLALIIQQYYYYYHSLLLCHVSGKVLKISITKSWIVMIDYTSSRSSMNGNRNAIASEGGVGWGLNHKPVWGVWNCFGTQLLLRVTFQVNVSQMRTE